MVRRQLSEQALPHRKLSDIILMLMRRRRRLLVRGDSMLPNLSDGDVVLVDDQAYVRRKPEVGHLVVARHPFRRDYHIIKRIAEVTEDGRYFLRGDNPLESSDSSSFGAIRCDNIVARVTSRL